MKLHLPTILRQSLLACFALTLTPAVYAETETPPAPSTPSAPTGPATTGDTTDQLGSKGATTTTTKTGGFVKEATSGEIITVVSDVVLNGVELGAQLDASGLSGTDKLKFKGGMVVNLDELQNITKTDNTFYSASADENDYGTANGSGFLTQQSGYQIVTGGKDKVVVESGTTWHTLETSTSGTGYTATEVVYTDGMVGAPVEKDFTTFWVNANTTVSLDEVDGNFKSGVTKELAMNGGTLTVDATLDNGIKITSKAGGTTSKAGGTIEITKELAQSQVTGSSVSGEEIYLTGTGTYNLGTGKTLNTGIKLGTDWKGTVSTGSLSSLSAADLNALGNSNSTVYVDGNADFSSQENVSVGSVTVTGNLTVTKICTTQNLEVGQSLNLNAAGKLLTVGGELNTTQITLGNIGASAEAQKLTGGTLNVTVATTELDKLNGSHTVLTLTESYTGTTTLNGDNASDGLLSSDKKRIITLVWEDPNTRAASTSLTLYAVANPDYVSDMVNGGVDGGNGSSGLDILDDAYTNSDPQTNAPDSALSDLMDTVDAGQMTNETLAAVAGASAAVLGQALSGDLDRQLNAMRNRCVEGISGRNAAAAKLGIGQALPNRGRYYAWINAEGNRNDQDADGTAAGYTLTSWGGTVGAGMQVNPRLTCGLALTDMRGDLDSDGPDSLKGDLDTTYLSGFAHYRRGRWDHAIIGTIGFMDMDYERKVRHAKGGYSSQAVTDGVALGLMYEASRDYWWRDNHVVSTVLNISYRHSSVDGYTERGSNAALRVGDQTLNTLTLGAGARYATTLPSRWLKRYCDVNARALVKLDLGDRQSEAGVGFVGQRARAKVESSETGVLGLELGGGVTVPMRRGSIFADGTLEFRSDYSHINATAGYRLQF